MSRPSHPPSGSPVNSIGTTRMLQALCVIGHTTEFLADQLRLPVATVTVLLHQPPPTVTADLAAAVTAVYQRWNLRPRPMSHADRRRLARLGWVSVLAWHDITDPQDRPLTDATDVTDVVDLIVQRRRWVPTATLDQRTEAARRLLRAGHTRNMTQMRTRLDPALVSRLAAELSCA